MLVSLPEILVVEAVDSVPSPLKPADAASPPVGVERCAAGFVWPADAHRVILGDLL